MDVKKQYFELVKAGVERAYESQLPKIVRVASLFGECMESGGIVQLFGVGHGQELVNELNYRAGGIAYYHGLKFRDLILKGLVKQEDIDSGAIYEDLSIADRFEEIYELDVRDLYCLVSVKGNEPLVLELARRAKEGGQVVVGVVNKESYDRYGGTLLEYCDAWLDMCADEPDTILDVGPLKTGQISSTLANIIGQMLTAEVYRYFTDRGKKAPVLLSANVKGADVHNNSLTDPYGRRIR